MTKNHSSGQQGYTLIELSIGLAVVSLVIASVLSGVKALMDSYSFNRTVTQISGVIEHINKMTRRDTDTKFITDFNLTRPDYNVFKDFQLTGGNDVSKAAPTITAANRATVMLGNRVTPSWSIAASDKHYKVFIGNISVGTCGDLASMLQDYAERIYIRHYDGTEQLVKDAGAAFNSNTVRTGCGDRLAYLVLEMNLDRNR